MVKCRFNMKTDILGLDITHYKFIKLGDKYAKLATHHLKNGIHKFVLTSRHKKNDFIMSIETVWELKEGKKTFKIIHSVVEIKLFGVIQQIFVVPESHKNILQDLYDML